MEKISIKGSNYEQEIKKKTGVVFVTEQELKDFAASVDFPDVDRDKQEYLYKLHNEVKRIIVLDETNQIKLKISGGEVLFEGTKQTLKPVLKENGISEWEIM